MAMKPLATSRTRDSVASTEQGAGRGVAPLKGTESAIQQDLLGQRSPGDGKGGRRPREERELDEQRRALARLLLGVFELEAAPVPTPSPSAQAGTAPAAPAAPPPRNPLLEQAVVDFMYALFHALDQIDDAEPTLAYVLAAGGTSAAMGRSAFGERIDLLAGRIAAAAPLPEHLAGGSDPASLVAGLETAYLGVLRVVQGDAFTPPAPGDSRFALSALLRRLANAMHVAPTLGYGASANTGALLRVRA